MNADEAIEKIRYAESLNVELGNYYLKLPRNDARSIVTLIEHQQKEIAELKTKLTYAEDAAAKGNLARLHAGGMEMEIAELRKDKEGLDWLENRNWTPEAALNLMYSVSIRQAIDAAMQETKPK